MTCITEMMSDAGQANVCAASSFWWAGPVAILVSALLGATIAFRSIRANREIAAKRATLDLIERSTSTEYYQQLDIAFKQVRKDVGGFEQLKSPTNPQLQEQRRRVLEYLNHYELIAVGIQQGALDEALFKSFRLRTVVRDWEAASDFVMHLRAPTPDSGSKLSSKGAFSNLQALATSWATEVERMPKGPSS